VEYSWALSQPQNLIDAEQISQELGIPIKIAEILVKREIDTPEKVKSFFRPGIGQIHDPFLMDGMNSAIERILLAIDKKEKILIYGDYDVDGTNSIAMLYLYFKEIGIEVNFYVPDRFKDGYGITNSIIDKLKAAGTNLIITVDFGINAVEEIKYAKNLNIDTIVCDHHNPGDILPDAVAILNPLKPGCMYPFKNLCGCGVTFKLIEGISRRINKPTIAYSYLQFVAIATMADIVSLIDENRVMVYYGLELINEAPRPGLKALMEVTGLSSKKITSSQIVFILAPRINAVGRLGDASRAVELLICDDFEKAIELSRVLEEENKNRSKIDNDIFQEAQELVEKILEIENDIAIILHEAEWHPGVIGVVASRLAEKYCRPTIIMTTIDGVAKGSARSIEGFNIYEALKKCQDKILQFGGHKYAAGLAVEIDKLDEFRASFNEVTRQVLMNRELKPSIQIDAEIDFVEITQRFREVLQNFLPYGPSNMRPVFLTKNIEVTNIFKLAGGDRIKLRVKQENISFDAICFNLSGKLPELEKAQRKIDIIFSIDEVDKSNLERFPIQLKIRDFKANAYNN
jgi:single-stranded-DNA-specific exonuclease